MTTMIGSLPKHRYVLVDSAFTHKESIGMIPAVWFGLVSFPGRMWGGNVLLECGAVYRSIPAHAIAFRKDAVPKWEPGQAQLWDCYGHDWTAVEYTYLRGLRCRAWIRGVEEPGEYLFTVAPLNDGFSECPEQAKEFVFIECDNGRLTIQPTNRVVFEDKSFTTGACPSDLKVQSEVWSCE
jgi:hypothetical protein